MAQECQMDKVLQSCSQTICPEGFLGRVAYARGANIAVRGLFISLYNPVQARAARALALARHLDATLVQQCGALL